MSGYFQRLGMNVLQRNRAAIISAIMALTAALAGCIPESAQNAVLHRVAEEELSPGVEICLEMEDTTISIGTDLCAEIVVKNNSPRAIIIDTFIKYSYSLAPLLREEPKDGRKHITRRPGGGGFICGCGLGKFTRISPGSSWVLLKIKREIEGIPRGPYEFAVDIGSRSEWEVFEEGNRDDPIYEGEARLSVKITLE